VQHTEPQQQALNELDTATEQEHRARLAYRAAKMQTLNAAKRAIAVGVKPGEVADHLGVAVPTLRQWRANGR